ncbi:pectinacetylesterase [Haloactinopolyspora alba]|uniref:Pectinacetylesterase n=1 Tax=Haloactinopolyspora alba TaxID=648780 RepID=A0A2P8E585_9ACTN|nr:pectin acetylesterase-family hydrolase [Haloactinopolyspora alba]PSL04625.1 pectinacetylesterase [Haloactinopolyspora alba]
MGDTPNEPRPDDTTDSSTGWRRWLSRRRIVAAGVALVVVAGVTAVGLSRDDPPTEAGGATDEAEAAAYEFATCMREQGIDDYPDPKVESDGSIFFEGVSELASGERMDAARSVCEPILDRVRPSDPGGSVEPGEQKTVAPAAAGWEEIVPGGDCNCADGSEFSFYAREADPEKVVLFLDGGGVCWSAETCRPGGANEYQRTVDGPDGEGVFDFADERNPFADHSFVFVPYCTGDLHIGDTTTEYASDLTVEHKGFVNGTAALDHLTATFPDATEIVVIGASAGSTTAPVYAGMLADRLPEATITSIADSSGSYPDVPEINDLLSGSGSGWGVAGAVPGWVENSRAGTGRFSLPGFVIRSARHAPDVTFARYDHAYDENQARHLDLTGVPFDDLLTLIDTNEARIEDAGVNLHSYTAPGDGHVAFGDGSFYTETVDGTALADWAADLVAGEPVDDVHCTDCTAG